MVFVSVRSTLYSRYIVEIIFLPLYSFTILPIKAFHDTEKIQGRTKEFRAESGLCLRMLPYTITEVTDV